MAITEKPKKSTGLPARLHRQAQAGRIPYIIIIAAILIVSWFSVYPNFIKTPDISVAQPIARAVVEKGELTKLIDDLFSNRQFTDLKQHGEYLPISSPTKLTSEEIKQIGPVGRPNPFTPMASIVPELSE